MEPTISSGDLLLVDVSVRSVTVDGVYVFEGRDEAFVRRASYRIDGSYVLSTDNPGTRTVDAVDGPKQAPVAGRVIWAWSGKRLF